MKRAALAALVAVALGSCADPKPSAPTPEDLADIDLSTDHTIAVDDDGYQPRTLDVEPGDVILLVNEGDGPHSFTADDQEFDTGRMLPGEETTLVLSDLATIDYFDLEEPDHRGTLVVEDP